MNRWCYALIALMAAGNALAVGAILTANRTSSDKYGCGIALVCVDALLVLFSAYVASEEF